MAEFRVPELGENVEKGDVVRVLVKPGDTIAKDQPVLELETDKATVEVPSTVSGIVREVAVKAGDKVSVGQLILTVDEQPAEAGAGPKPQPAGAPEEGGLSQRGTSAAPSAAAAAPAVPPDTRPAAPAAVAAAESAETVRVPAEEAPAS
ncbi:MAG TPA: biotin/lipoyl-containing protein, partial [Vicinamibacterales bacterium]|nr:biotin/lipoyl-containing protein [Vicinamibacterales bacterium]